MIVHLICERCGLAGPSVRIMSVCGLRFQLCDRCEDWLPREPEPDSPPISEGDDPDWNH